MSIIQIFIGSVKFKGLLELRKKKFIPVLIYFLLLNLIVSFPLNEYTLANQGISLSKIGLDLTSDIPNWFPSQLPGDCSIDGGQLNCLQTTLFHQDYGNMEFVINPAGNYSVSQTGNVLVFETKSIVFYSEGKAVQTFNYNDYPDMNFTDLSKLNGTDAANIILAGLQSQFGSTTTLFTIIWNTGQNILMNAVFIFLVSLLGLLFKLRHSVYPTYPELLKLFVFCMTWPAVVSFIAGLLQAFAFIPVIMQFGTPLVFLLLYYTRISRMDYQS